MSDELDALRRRIAELEQRISYYEKPLSDNYRCQHRFTEQGICIRCGEDAEEWDAGCVEEIAADVMEARQRIAELEQQLAQTWQPVEDETIVTGDIWPTVITVRGDKVDVSNMGFALPDNVRLCKREELKDD